MIPWVKSFFDNEHELAMDVRNEYLDLLRAGESGRKATRAVIDGFSEELADSDVAEPIMWMALAVTQWEYGRLEPRVKSRALRAIKDGGDIRAYPEDRQHRRRLVLERVKARLESPQPPERRVRIARAAVPLRNIEQNWKPGQIVAFRRDSGRYALLLTEGVFVHEYMGQIPHFVPLKWEGAKLPSFDRIVRLQTTDDVIGVYPNAKGEPIPWDRIQRLDLTMDVTGLATISDDEVFCENGCIDCRWSELDDEL